MLKACSRCGEEKPATPEFFVLCPPKARTKNGITSPCRDCHKKRMKVLNRRTYQDNRAKGLLRTYRTHDRNAGRESGLTEQQLATIIEKPCYYCGTTDALRGADRVDNALGHTLANVVPACRTCNMVRNDLFSVEEMRQLGAVIAKIVATRL